MVGFPKILEQRAHKSGWKEWVIAMTSERERDSTNEVYAPPKILATYDRQTLEETVQPHGQTPPYDSGGGCGCGGGSILQN